VASGHVRIDGPSGRSVDRAEPLGYVDHGRVNVRKAAIALHDVSYESGGRRIEGFLLVPPGDERRPAVVFVHGLWLLPSSWDRWRAHFEAAGYSTLAPGWPDDPDAVEEANRFVYPVLSRRSGGWRGSRCRRPLHRPR